MSQDIPYVEFTPEQVAFEELLDRQLNEQVYQNFLEEHTRFIPREFRQHHDIHLHLVLRKLKLAENLVTDYCYLSGSSMDWHCVLVEIEKPSSKYFSSNRSLHSDFRHALEQIDEWKAWLEVEGNKQHLLQETLAPLFGPNSCWRKPVHFKYALVMGRRSEYINQERMKLIRVKESSDFKILSYDSLLESPDKNELYIGERKSDRIDIITDHFISDYLFSAIPHNQLKVKKSLKTDAENKRDQWHCLKTLEVYCMESVLPVLATID